MSGRLRLGVSACLLGEKVRWDGRHKRDPFIAGVLDRHADLVPFCPEVEAGFGAPREPMRLEGNPAAPRLVGIRSRADKTGPLTALARRRAAGLARAGLDGLIFKSASPSCGLRRVGVHRAGARPLRRGTGIFALLLTERLPLLPATEEESLRDPDARRDFIGAVFTMRRWRRMLALAGKRALVDFHTRHKFLLLARRPAHYRALGKLAASPGRLPPPGILDEYGRLLAEAMRLGATRGRQANVLRHMLGYFKRESSPEEKRDALAAVEKYRLGRLSPAAPLAVIGRLTRKYRQTYLAGQWYLEPEPLERLLGGA